MTFSVQQLPQPLLLDQAVLDPTWNNFKTFMVVLGGILFFWVFGEKMFLLGKMVQGQSTPAPTAITQPATPVAPVLIQQNTAPQPKWSSYADCQRAYVLTLRRDPEGACDTLK